MGNLWKLKVAIQFLLSKIPFGEQINFWFQHANNAYSQKKIEIRIKNHIKHIKKIQKVFSIHDARVVEIGPGWLPISAILFYLCGAKEIILFDHVPHMRLSLAKKTAKIILDQQDTIEQQLRLPKKEVLKKVGPLLKVQSLEEYFNSMQATYEAPRDFCKNSIGTQSIDVVYSVSVFEHIPKETTEHIFLEIRRILKKQGVCYIFISLDDHYHHFDKSLSKINFLKYSEKVWDFFVQNKISYHNRLREKEYIDMLKIHGAIIKKHQNYVEQKDIDFALSTKLDSRFNSFSAKELAILCTSLIFSFKKNKRAVATEKKDSQAQVI